MEPTRSLLLPAGYSIVSDDDRTRFICTTTSTNTATASKAMDIQMPFAKA